MFELTAEGSDAQQRWKHALTDGRPYVLGRETACDLVVSWDAAISRRHLRITATDERVQVERLAEATILFATRARSSHAANCAAAINSCWEARCFI